MDIDISIVDTILGGAFVLVGQILINRLKFFIDNRRLDIDERKTDQELSDASINSALLVLKTLERRVEEQEKKISTQANEIGFLKDTLEEETQARLRSAEDCKVEISKRDREIQALRSANNITGQQNALFKQRIARLEQRVGTGELTPPPHNIPDSTPPIPTRDDWQEPPPINEAPNE